MGTGTEIAQAVAETLLGKNGAGFTRAMKRNKERDAAGKSGGSSDPSASSGESEREEPLAGMRKGGRVRATGVRKLHKGEMVARKAGRSKCRGGKR